MFSLSLSLSLFFSLPETTTWHWCGGYTVYRLITSYGGGKSRKSGTVKYNMWLRRVLAGTKRKDEEVRDDGIAAHSREISNIKNIIFAHASQNRFLKLGALLRLSNLTVMTPSLPLQHQTPSKSVYKIFDISR